MAIDPSIISSPSAVATGTIALTPYVAPLRTEARAVLVRALAALLEVDSSGIATLERPAFDGPTIASLRAPSGEILRVYLHPEPRGWIAGPVGVTFERPESGEPRDPEHRKLLLRLAARFGETQDGAALVACGVALAAADRRWAQLLSIDDRFYRHVEHAHSGVTGLLRAGFRCNQDCHFCWQGRDWPSAPDDLVFQWLDELAGHGVTRLTVCGGEPTIWKPLPELIERATRVHGMRTHLNTNAIRMRQPGYARMLREKGLRTMLVSLHSHDAATSDRMTRAPGTHTRTVEGIRAALDAGLLVILNCAVERDNVTTLADHARFVVREFVDGRTERVAMVNYSQPGRYHDAHGYLARIVPIDEVRPHVTAAARILHAAGVLLEITGSCGFPACVVSDVPELAPWRAPESFDTQHKSARSHPVAACRECAAREQCIGVRHEYVALHGGRGLLPYAALPRSDWYERLAASPMRDAWAWDDPSVD